MDTFILDSFESRTDYVADRIAVSSFEAPPLFVWKWMMKILSNSALANALLFCNFFLWRDLKEKSCPGILYFG